MQSPVIELNGEWEFYPNSLKKGLSDSDPVIKTVPHFWENDEDMGLSPYGFGTYLLRITGLKPSVVYAVQITDEVTAYRLYANDNVIAENGQTGSSKDTYYPQWKPTQAVFSTDENGNAELVMEISNFDYYRGGFWNNIKFGLAENIMKQTTRANLLNMFLATSILIMGFLNIFLFFLYKKRGKAHCFFLFSASVWAFVFC